MIFREQRKAEWPEEKVRERGGVCKGGKELDHEKPCQRRECL